LEIEEKWRVSEFGQRPLVPKELNSNVRKVDVSADRSDSVHFDSPLQPFLGEYLFLPW
jgi:hypothetical protein